MTTAASRPARAAATAASNARNEASPFPAETLPAIAGPAGPGTAARNTPGFGGTLRPPFAGVDPESQPLFLGFDDTRVGEEDISGRGQ